MARLLIVDQSLKGVGGHHYDYTLQTSCAAARLGLDVVAVTNQKFGGCRQIDQFAQVLPHFRRTTYSPDSLLSGLRALNSKPSIPTSCPIDLIPYFDLFRHSVRRPAAAPEQMASYEKEPPFTQLRRKTTEILRNNGFLGNRKLWKEHHRRRQQVQLFQESCRALFSSLKLSASDHVFFSTINDIELAGLIGYWATCSDSSAPTWHLQFHFDVFDGRPYTQKLQLPFFKPLKKLFHQIDRVVPYHQIRFYGTTEAIVNQYRQISCYDFSELIYPISGCLQPDSNSQLVRPDFGTHLKKSISDKNQNIKIVNGFHNEDRFSKPLQVSIAGGVRSEKGQEKLKRILPELCTRLFSPGLAKISLQRKQSKKLLSKKPFQLDLPSNVNPDCIEYLPHPLSADSYTDFISNTDIGLITYDPNAYHSRRAGVFCEYLASGVPVIAPTACWMADEIQKVDQIYRKHVESEFPTMESWTYRHLQWQEWNLPTGGGKINFDGIRSPAQASIRWKNEESDNHSKIMHLKFHWIWHKQPGFYLQIQAKFVDKFENVCSHQKATLGTQLHETQCGTLFEVPANAEKVFLGFSNACGEETLSIDRLRVDLLDTGNQSIPVGCIGRTYQDETEIPLLLEHLCENYNHYRSNTKSYQFVWQQDHNPQMTIEQLIHPKDKSEYAFAS